VLYQKTPFLPLLFFYAMHWQCKDLGHFLKAALQIANEKSCFPFLGVWGNH
jgi:hypothetical protein